jgi:hypothetical protein
MRSSIFPIASVLLAGLIGCKAQSAIANHSDLADNPTPSDPAKFCPDICGVGTLCEFPDGSCMEVCNSCYCMRDGGTVVQACPKGEATPRAFQTTGVQVMAAGDGARAR